MIRFRRLLLFIFLLPLITGCASGSNATAISSEGNGQVNDLSCAYFYFLWGTHAEYSQRFDEALEAFEKALICDPAVTYIEKKLPVLLFRLGKTDRAIELLQEGLVKDPEDTSQHLLLAYLAIQQNRRDEAIDLYLQVLQREPANESVRLRLGILYVQQNNLDEAEKLFRDLIARNQEIYLARIYLARLLIMKEDSAAATKIYEEALRLNWSPELVFEMVGFYSSQERHTDVLRLYNSVLANDSSNERAILGRVQTLLSLGRDEEALVELRNLRETNANMDRLDMAIAKTLLRLGKPGEAATILEGLKQGEMQSEANYLLGLIAFQEKRMESSLGYFQNISPDSAEYPDAIYMQVRILRDFGRHDRAFSLLQKATTEPAGRDPLFFALLSSLYLEKDRKEEALATLIAGTTVFPENEQLYFEHALLLERSGQKEQALTAMQKVLDISPDNPEALNYIGYTWADLNMNLQEAREYIIRAVELKPENGFIRDSLGWVEFRLGNFETALKELLHALELEPGDPNIFVHLGQVYRALNRIEDARNAYLKGLELFTDETEKATIQKKIDELQSN